MADYNRVTKLPTVAELEKAKENGISYENVYSRVNILNWDMEKAITDPVQSQKGPRSLWSEYRKEAVKNGVSRHLFSKAIDNGLPPEEAVKPMPWGKGGNRRKISRELEAKAAANDIPYEVLRGRINVLKWDDEKAATTPSLSKQTRRYKEQMEEKA